jgi:hypothetical protein
MALTTLVRGRIFLQPGSWRRPDDMGLRGPPKSELGDAAIGSVPAQILREVEQAVLVATGIAAR